jgi:cardiolipin synthase C
VEKGCGFVLLALALGLASEVARSEARFFSGTEVLPAASAKLQVKEAHLITDNDAAFESKLTAIRSARQGELIRLIYDRYGSDESASVFTSELIKAARRGVFVHLIVDFSANYKNLDLFYMMEAKSGNSLQVRFYGRPSDQLFRDAQFMTSPCPPESETNCADWKWKNQRKDPPDDFARLLISGLLAKDPLAIKAALLLGGQFDSKKNKYLYPAEGDRQRFQDFYDLFYKAKFQGDLISALKVQMSLALKGDLLKFLNHEIFSRVPLEQMAKTSFQDWEQLDDTSHHHLLLIGERFAQVGGRAIENVYHAKSESAFSDTDLAFTMSAGGGALAQAFDNLWNFNPMIADLKKIEKTLPHEFIANPASAEAAFQKCARLPNSNLDERQQVGQCLADKVYWNGGKDLFERVDERFTQMNEMLEKYETVYKPTRIFDANWKNNPHYALAVSPEELDDSFVAYLENLHFNKAHPSKRIHGAMNGREFWPWKENEISYGRNIHYVWRRELENVCYASARDGLKRQIILHSAHILLPVELVRTFGKMMDGSWDCSKVQVLFLTNSIETANLNMTNIYSAHQMKAFFDVFHARKAHFGSEAFDRAADFEYYEYAFNPSKPMSLHSNVMVFGDDLFVGSANADVHDFYMNTNNGIFMRNVPNLVATYTTMINDLIKAPGRLRPLTVSFEVGDKDELRFLDILMNQYHLDKRIGANWKEQYKGLQQDFSRAIDETMRMLLSKDYEEPKHLPAVTEKGRIQNDKEAAFNRFVHNL